MSAPAQTYFCGNGHKIVDISHGDIILDVPPCNHCDNDKVYMVLEWYDPDYGDIDENMPHKPIRYESKTIEVDIPVYDISKLKELQGENGVGRELWQ